MTFPEPDRKKKVKASMQRIRQVLGERDRDYELPEDMKEDDDEEEDEA